MTRPTAQTQGRAGITLTEVLISILIMGVGLISLATLFPLGLLRLRAAARDSRSALLGESALAELQARNMLSKSTFKNPYVTPWYGLPPDGQGYDPLTQDWFLETTSTVNRAASPVVFNPTGIYHLYGPGLPFCYDPLWRVMAVDPTSTTGLPGVYPAYTTNASHIAINESRFASGIGFVSPDASGTGTYAQVSAHGLQRVYNFKAPGLTSGFLATQTNAFQLQSQLGSIFASQDDLVFNPLTSGSTGTTSALANGSPSPVLPDMSSGGPVSDWNYSWFFTGHQVDVNDTTMLAGDIVVCNNRPFNLDTVQSPYGGSVPVPLGETVVEAIFGYGKVVYSVNGYGYAPSTSRTILLRWAADIGTGGANVPDPEVRVGGWIADVTYQRYAALDGTFNTEAITALAANPAFDAYPLQRCHWYRVVRRTASEEEKPGTTPLPATAGYRRMTVTVDTPLQSLTLLNDQATGSSPVHTNAALIMPSVVNVFPKTIVTR